MYRQNRKILKKNLLKKDKIFTVANGITLLRIVCTIIMIFCIKQASYATASLFFIIAAITDFFDGFIARLCNEESILGSYLDPIADKFLVLSAFFLFYSHRSYSIPPWFLILLFVRELLLVFGGIVLYFCRGSAAIIAPTAFSKINTAILLFFIFIIFVSQLFAMHFSYLFSFFILVSTVFTIVSCVQYTVIFIKKITN